MTYESSGEYLAKKQAPLPGYESPGEYLTDYGRGSRPRTPATPTRGDEEVSGDSCPNSRSPSRRPRRLLVRPPAS